MVRPGLKAEGLIEVPGPALVSITTLTEGTQDGTPRVQVPTSYVILTDQAFMVSGKVTAVPAFPRHCQEMDDLLCNMAGLHRRTPEEESASGFTPPPPPPPPSGSSGGQGPPSSCWATTPALSRHTGPDGVRRGSRLPLTVRVAQASIDSDSGVHSRLGLVGHPSSCRGDTDPVVGQGDGSSAESQWKIPPCLANLPIRG
jgi:hypothetical protein